MTDFPTLDDLDPAGKTVLLRADLNVPVSDGRVTDATRIERSLPSIRELIDKGAKVVVLSHFGRPKGERRDDMSLRPVGAALSDLLGGVPFSFAEDCIGEAAERAIGELPPGGVVLLENLRFHKGEEANDQAFAEKLAALGDLYVNDAFSAAHRAHASVEALAHLLPSAAGRLMQAELEALTAALERPERPVAALIGGAKVSTKLEVLGHLIEKVELIVIGGAMANTFLHARGIEVGNSLCEREMAETARQILDDAEAAGCDIVLPQDAVVAEKLAENVASDTVAITEVPADRMILDLGPKSAAEVTRRLEGCKTLVWNGPLGAFEVPPFDAATVEVARAVGRLTEEGALRSVAGGGDTVAALGHAGVLDKLTYVSTAGGAFLEWLEGKSLPGVEALKAKAAA